MLERHIKRYLLDGVNAVEGETRKVRWEGRNGAPDQLVWLPGWVVAKFAELKRPGKKLEAHQVREHARLRRMGFDVVKLDTYADVDAFLK